MGLLQFKCDVEKLLCKNLKRMIQILNFALGGYRLGLDLAFW